MEVHACVCVCQVLVLDAEAKGVFQRLSPWLHATVKYCLIESTAGNPSEKLETVTVVTSRLQ